MRKIICDRCKKEIEKKKRKGILGEDEEYVEYMPMTLSEDNPYDFCVDCTKKFNKWLEKK